VDGSSPAKVGFWATAWEWIAVQRAPKTDMGAEGDDGQVVGGQVQNQAGTTRIKPRVSGASAHHRSDEGIDAKGPIRADSA
jgi:hypothetical protein